MVRVSLYTRLIIIAIILIFPCSLWPLPENYSARQVLSEYFTESPASASRAASKMFPQEGNFPAVRFIIEKQRDSFYLLFMNEKDFKFPQAGAGNYIIRRNLSGGEIEQIKIFIKDDPDCFIRIFPEGKRGRMDLFLYGEQIYKSVPLPLGIDAFLTEPFSFIEELTADSVRWDLIFPEVSEVKQKTIETLGAIFRKKLPDLLDAEDGAMEYTGEYVRISDGTLLENPGLNCSGFVKWITDSLYKTKTGHYLAIEDLTLRHLEYRGNRWSNSLEWQRDPFFGLDWIRNCAVSLLRLEKEKAGPEDSDIRKIPFFSYKEDLGYPVERLTLLLYLLAAEKPGYFYLGSINGPFGTDKILRQHYHVAAFFPYLDKRGNLQTVVLERSKETPVKEFQGLYRNEYLHLVGIEGFLPSSFPPFPEND